MWCEMWLVNGLDEMWRSQEVMAAEMETWNGLESSHRILTVHIHNQEPPLDLPFHSKEDLDWLLTMLHLQGTNQWFSSSLSSEECSYSFWIMMDLLNNLARHLHAHQKSMVLLVFKWGFSPSDVRKLGITGRHHIPGMESSFCSLVVMKIKAFPKVPSPALIHKQHPSKPRQFTVLQIQTYKLSFHSFLLAWHSNSLCR